MSERVTVDPVVQKDSGDCAVACLAMFLGVGYAEMRKRVHRNAGSEGMTDRQIINAARKFGCRLKFVGAGDEALGILKLERAVEGKPRTMEYHVVMFMRGVIFNPADGLIWVDPDAFFKARRWRPLGVFVEESE